MRLHLLTLAAATLAGCSRGGSGAAPAAPAPAGLAMRLTSVPAGTTGQTVFVAGTFNNWNPGDPAFRLAALPDGQYRITLPDSVRGRIEFKFTLGSWDRVELGPGGAGVPNRVFVVPPTGPATWTGTVVAWRDAAEAPRPSTARAGVAVLDTAFAIPQLNRTRRVWIYLPSDYATSQRRYPVLYMQDGQNVFDAATSFAGEWGLDETLDSLRALGDSGVIVVAVDNGGPLRLNEYVPWPMHVGTLRGGGQGGEYADFLALTLKPWIDVRYRTRPDRLSTGVGGSSAGGHIAMYAALRHPDVFGRVLAFSPSFFVNPELFALARRYTPRRPATRFYFISGLEEGANTGLGLPDRVFARSQGEMVDTLRVAGVDAGDMISLLPADGAHAEWFWRREFPAAYRWLFRP